MGRSRRTQPRCSTGRGIVHISAHLEEFIRADGWLHGNAGERFGEIDPLAGSRPESDSGSDAARGLPFGPIEIWSAAGPFMNRLRPVGAAVFASLGTLLP